MPLAERPRLAWRLHTCTLALRERTLVMGIVNVTPDSFSDGGAYASTQEAIDHGLRLLEDGADILDIGGESTRPGSPAGTAEALGADAELHRVLPVIEGVLAKRPEAVLSVDTYRAATARAAVQAGAEIVNDVSGMLWDADMPRVLAALQCGVVLMHTRGLPSAWAQQPPLDEHEVLPLVQDGLRARLAAAAEAGIADERIVLDPGFGFGKRGAENRVLLHGLSGLHALGRPLLIGLSRKGFLAPELPPQERDPATHAADAIAVEQGAHILRVHDVAGARASLVSLGREAC